MITATNASNVLSVLPVSLLSPTNASSLDLTLTYQGALDLKPCLVQMGCLPCPDGLVQCQEVDGITNNMFDTLDVAVYGTSLV